MKKSQLPASRAATGFIVVFVLLAFGIIASGGFYFRHYKDGYVRSVEEQLSTVADLRIAELVQWRTNHLSDAAVYQGNPSFAKLVEGILENPADADSRRQIVEWLGNLSKVEDYDQVCLIDPQGGLIFSLPADPAPLSPEIAGKLAEVLSSGKTLMQDFYHSGRDEEAHLAVLVPIYEGASQGGRPLAVLKLRIDPEIQLVPIVTRWPTRSITSESYIVRRDKDEAVVLNRLRLLNNKPLSFRIPSSESGDPAVSAAFGNTGAFNGVDYRDGAVVSALRSIPDSPWALVTQIDKQEAFAPVWNRFWETVLMIGILLFAAGAWFGFIVRQNRLTFYKQRVKDAELLAESEMRFRSTFELAATGIANTNLDGRWIRVNSQLCKIFGYPEAELLQKNFQEITHPDDLAEDLAFLKRLLAGEIQTYTMEKRFIRKDSSVVHANLTVALACEANGDPSHFIAVIDDISARKQAEEKLKLAEARYRNIVEITPDAIFTHRNNRIDYVNAACMKLMKASDPSQILGRTPYEMFVEDQHPVIRERIQRLLESPCSVPWMERGLLALDGTMIQAEVAAASFYDSGCMSIQVVCRDLTDRKKAENELRQTAGLLGAVVEGTADAVFVKDIEGRYLLCNQATAGFVGLQKEEIIGKDDTYLFGEEDAAKVMEINRRVCETGVAEINEEILTAAGVTRTYLGTKAPYRDANGMIIGTIGISHEITDRKRAERSLQEANSLLNATLESTADGILVVNCHRKIASYNKKFLELWHIDPQLMECGDDRTVLKNILSQLENPSAFVAKVDELYAAPQADSWDVLKFRDGRHFERYSQPQRIGDEIVGRVWSFRDITERKRTEVENARLAKAVENASETIFITDRTGTIQYANPSFERTTGYPRKEAIGLNPRILKSGVQDAAFYRQMWDTLIRGKIWSGHFTNRRRDGSLYEEEATISPILDSNGKILNFVAVKRDVSHEYQLQEQFRQAQKMEAVGRLAGGVAHDFNNILGAILLQADIAAANEDASIAMRDALAEIRSDAMRAAELTRQLLLFSRQQVIRMQDLDLNLVVANVSRMLQRIIGEDVPLSLTLAPGELAVHGDAGTLEQVLLNLAVNARDAMPEGGTLAIATSRREISDEVARTNPDAMPGSYVMLEVRDNGSGIPPEIVSRIFEPFFTTKDVGKGTGLGLATVFGIVKQHGGWLEVDSKVGEGTAFRIHFPMKENAAAIVTCAEEIKPAGGTETILVTEDEPSLRMLVCTVLRLSGYQILEAANGKEALKIWQDQPNGVDLLLTDMVMPSGMSGRELAQTLQASRCDLKTIFMSGYSVDLASSDVGLEEGLNFLQKPFTPTQLLKTVRKALDS